MATLHEVMVERLKSRFGPTALALIRKMAKICGENGEINMTMPDIVALVPGSAPVKYRCMQTLVKEGYIKSKPRNHDRDANVVVYYTLEFPNSGVPTKEQTRVWITKKNRILWEGLHEIEKLCKIDPSLSETTHEELLKRVSEVVAQTVKHATWRKQSTNDSLGIY